MSDIRSWLEHHGLGKYAQTLAENEVDWAVLPELTDADLREVGLPLGARKKLLKAILVLDAAASEVERAPVASSGDRPAGDAERRQLTVMFCDLAGSVSLGERLDVEDYRDLLAGFRAAVLGAIERHLGFVARHQGDGILAYFGYPQAREDDAERAVRAGLEVVGAVRGLEPPGDAPLAVRVGIATGPAVVGDVLSTGASARAELAALGRTPNLAARLQGEAEPGTVLISPTTRELTSGLFQVEALPPRELKGLAEALAPYRVRAEVQGESRFVARAGRSPSPFLGREEELSLLVRRWSRAAAGRGQVALITGEAGIGKSRLLQRLRENIDAEPHEAIVLQCAPYHEASAFHPVIAGLERALGGSDGAAAEGRAERLRRHLEAIGAADRPTQALVAGLLSLPPAGPDASPDASIDAMDGPERRERTLRALVEYVRLRSARAPVLCAFEDLHWADPSTLELLERLVRRIEPERVLLVATSRPGFEARWTDLAHTTMLSLCRLPLEVVRALARAVSPTLSEPEVEGILSRAAGNPLFAEELARTLSSSSADAPIPATLQDSLTERLDAAGAGKAVAQCAAVIGRTFAGGLLEGVWSGTREALARGLEALERAGLVTRQGEGGLARYEFRHALVRDTAYGLLLREPRERHHRAAALALEACFPEVVAGQPEHVAHHWEAAGAPERALPYLVRAAERANAHSAHAEATAHAERGLTLLGTDPAPELAEPRAALLLERGRALAATRGTAAPELEELYTRAFDLARGGGLPGLAFRALGGLASYQLTAARPEAAVRAAEALAGIGAALDDPYYAAEAERYLGIARYHTSDYPGARRHLESSLAWFELSDDVNARVELLRYLQWTYRVQGDYSACWRTGARLVREAGDAGIPAQLARALASEAENLEMRGEHERLLEQSERLTDIAAEYGLAMLGAMGSLARAHAFYELRDRAEAIAAHEAAIDAYEALGARNRLGPELGLLAVNLARAGRLLAAAEAAARALGHAGLNPTRTGIALVLAGEALRIVCEAGAAAPGVEGDPESLMTEGLRQARAVGNKDAELEAALSLARLHAAQGRFEAARAVLRPVYATISEHQEVAAIRAAGRLLRELG
jgi:class 3 adenylate cyclase/DNA-binding transcriptional ArsR family regulator